ncbi:GNAT family N-acetyltransferase [Lacisediminihabitans changchengi]|uniref:GNAT family N-acetyltransferase n=1 Tax=Lacisediminihabitans changchengi TaxID=2787634 RepID=A0A934VY96_9MICO|nr:GNAT family N-acetyltransferase [Lacisediminihabitans changchengi]MBK4347777.1 GNAT family N-acetyltransferase [Lacisediminihabitans changchengi]
MSITAVTSPVSIRSASGDDADSVFALVVQLGIGGAPQRASFDEAFAHSVQGAYDHILLVAEVDGAVVGYALATVARLLYTNGDVAQLQELVVDSTASGNGYGSQLVGAIERECEARGIRQLTVASILRGASFYERLNYRSTANYLKKSFLLD